MPTRLRGPLLHLVGYGERGIDVQSRVLIRNRLTYIGKGSFINQGVVFEGRAPITLGSKVALAPDVLILTSTHAIGPTQWRAGNGTPEYRPVTVGDGSWIGARTLILPGVSIGAGCVIAAGSVVIDDCPPNTLWAGVPAVFKRPLLDADALLEDPD